MEIIYYDTFEGHSECEVTMGVESNFEDIDVQDNRFLNTSIIEQVLEEVPEMKVDRKGKGKAAEQQDLLEEKKYTIGPSCQTKKMGITRFF
jgi:hypothetical protein